MQNTVPAPSAAAYTTPTSHEAMALLDELRLTLEELPEGTLRPAAWMAFGTLYANVDRLCSADELAAA